MAEAEKVAKWLGLAHLNFSDHNLFYIHWNFTCSRKYLILKRKKSHKSRRKLNKFYSYFHVNHCFGQCNKNHIIKHNYGFFLIGTDCGVFVCQFMEYLSRDAKLTFCQDDMPYFRKRMVYEIVTNQIMDT